MKKADFNNERITQGQKLSHCSATIRSIHRGKIKKCRNLSKTNLNSIQPHVVLSFSENLKTFSVIYVCNDEIFEGLRGRLREIIKVSDYE